MPHIVTKGFNRSAHHHGDQHHSDLKRHLKHAAHHRERMALRAAARREDWEAMHAPVQTRPASEYDIC